MLINYSKILALVILAGLLFVSGCIDEKLGYSSMKAHEIPGSVDGALSDYQVQFVVHNMAGIDTARDIYLNGSSLSWPNDIRFTNVDKQKLSYWIQSNNSSDAIVWVKMDSIAASPATTRINVYYGKAGDVGESNGSATFMFFDDFNGTSVDLNKWNITRGSPTLANSRMTMTSGSEIYSNAVFPLNSSRLVMFGDASIVPNAPYWGFASSAGAICFKCDIYNNYQASTGIPGNYALAMLGSRYYGYHVWDLYRSSRDNRAHFLIDGNSVASIGSCVPDETVGLPIFIANYDSSTIDFDWLFIRKYTPNEPFQPIGVTGSAASPNEIRVDKPSG